MKGPKFNRWSFHKIRTIVMGQGIVLYGSENLLYLYKLTQVRLNKVVIVGIELKKYQV